ncbi:MAG: hypothetical protein ISQ13_03945 [Candidatus Margulisbacteria bacterium]|nr:hypothetical protein [Candidatus Margulisiibacteriota bacterium]
MIKRCLQFMFKRLRSFGTNTKGNAQLLVTAGAIFATMAIYFFVTLTAIDQELKEKTAHLYNAYQMGISINALIKNRIFTKGQLEVSYQDEEGENRFTKDEFQKYVQLDTDTVFTLSELINDELILDSRDPTATRINASPTNYDRHNTKVKVIFDMVIDHYDNNGDAIKKVVGVKYMVNLAGQPMPSDSDIGNAPYLEGDPFYYLVSYEDEAAGLSYNDITLKTAGIVYDGVLDTSTFGVGPQATHVIILPGEDTDN